MGLKPGEPRPDALRAAVVQMDVAIGANAANCERIAERMAEAAAAGARLVVFPECSLSGYCFDSLMEALPYAEPLHGDRLRRLAEEAERLGITCVVGFLERAGEHDRRTDGAPGCCNSAAILWPGGGAVYRKTHLPTLGVDRFVTPGDRLAAIDAPAARLGTLICYDVRFSEAARVLGLDGAEVLALPTNWPEGAESSPDFITRARAWESRFYLLAANRVGVERGRRFIGRSQVVAPSGEVLAEAGPDEERVLVADLDLAETHRKRVVIEPGEWELDATGDRRPGLYARLASAPPDDPGTGR